MNVLLLLIRKSSGMEILIFWRRIRSVSYTHLKKDNRIVKADYPKALLKGSPVSASIAAAIMNGKYVNAFPLYRLEKEFERYGLAITRQNMDNWMIRRCV